MPMGRGKTVLRRRRVSVVHRWIGRQTGVPGFVPGHHPHLRLRGAIGPPAGAGQTGSGRFLGTRKQEGSGQTSSGAGEVLFPPAGLRRIEEQELSSESRLSAGRLYSGVAGPGGGLGTHPLQGREAGGPKDISSRWRGGGGAPPPFPFSPPPPPTPRPP